MQTYIYLALLSALLMGLYSVAVKLFIRYRLCSPTLVTIGYCIAAGLISLGIVLVAGYKFPTQIIPLFIAAAIATFLAHLLMALAMQEGDASTVVPLLGLKIPFTTALAFLFLGESFPATIYIAVGISAMAVMLFGLGKPAATQGGHDKHPIVAIFLATVSAFFYSISDIFAKKCLEHLPPIQLIMFINIAIAIPCIGLFCLPTFRKYKIAIADLGGLLCSAALLTAGIATYFTAIKYAGNVTVPNIILASRAFIVLLLGIALNRLVSIPFERQSRKIYLLRFIATSMLFASLVIILIQK